MLRNAFVAFCITLGAGAAIRGPYYTLLFYLWFSYFRPDAWLYRPWTLELRLPLIVGTIAVVQTLLFANQARWRRDPVLLLLLLTAAHTCVSALLSVAPEWSWFWWTDFAKVLLIAYLLVLHVTDRRRLWWVFVIMGASLGFEAAKQGLAQFVLNPGAPNHNPHPVLGDNNGVAVGMFMLAPLLLAAAANATTAWQRWGLRLLVVGVSLRGIATYSRGGFLAAGVLACVYGARSTHRLRVFTGIGLVALLGLSVMPDQFWERMGTITASQDERDASSASRLYFWRVAADMAAAYPWFGVGFNAFPRAYDAHDESGGQYGYARAVHSTWFGMLAENGLPGLTLLLTLLIASTMSADRARRTYLNRGDSPAAAYPTALQASLIVYCVGGSFINAHYQEMVWHIFALTAVVKHLAREELRDAKAAATPVILEDQRSSSWPARQTSRPNTTHPTAMR